MKKNKQLIAIVSVLLHCMIINAQNTYPWPSTGYVGIGTTSPAYTLVVSNGGANGFEIDPTGASGGLSTNLLSFNRSTSLYTPLTLSAKSIRLSTPDASNAIFIESNGKVGIGNNAPTTGFDVSGAEHANWIASFRNTALNGHNLYMGYNNGTSRYGLYIAGGDGTSYSRDFAVGTGEDTKFVVLGDGRVGIGTIDPAEKLSVNGNIKAKKITVSQTGWSDYVFEPAYPLKPLSEVAEFIKVNKHLPDVPSAKEVEEKGLNLGDNQALLLKKIEELTLYVIALEQKVNNLEAKK